MQNQNWRIKKYFKFIMALKFNFTKDEKYYHINKVF